MPVADGRGWTPLTRARRRKLWLWVAWLTAVGLVVLVGIRMSGWQRGSLLALLLGALPVTMLAVYPVLAVAVAMRQRLLTAVAVGLIAAHAAVVAPALGARPLPEGAREASRLRVVTANVQFSNPDPVAAGRALLALGPDLLVVPELTRGGLAGLTTAGLLDRLPHAAYRFDDGHTVGLFSRLPLTDVALLPSSTRVLPRATVSVGGQPVRVLTTHPLPPVLSWEPAWRAALADLRAEVERVDGPLVVAGDLNADRDHAPFRRLLTAGLRDAHDEHGRGLARTWPQWLPLLHLDHVLVRDGAGTAMVVLAVREHPLPGSDHRAVVADLAVLGSVTAAAADR